MSGQTSTTSERRVLRVTRRPLRVAEEYYELTYGQVHDKYKHMASTKYKKDKYGEVRQISSVGRSSTCWPAKYRN